MYRHKMKLTKVVPHLLPVITIIKIIIIIIIIIIMFTYSLII
jgi:hypothetical protein